MVIRKIQKELVISGKGTFLEAKAREMSPLQGWETSAQVSQLQRI